jgi:hypothetical protein
LNVRVTTKRAIMKLLHKLTTILLCLQISLSFAATPTTKNIHVLSPDDMKKIHEVVNDVRKAILSKDTKEILKHVSVTNGLSCTDTNYTHKEVKKFLSNKGSYLYISLFDSTKFSKQCGMGYPKEYPALADNEFFQTAHESIKISMLDNDWVEVTIESPIKTHYQRVWSLHREAKSWKVSGGSFIIGNCTCG